MKYFLFLPTFSGPNHTPYFNLFTSLSRSRVVGAHRTHSKTHGVSEGWETMSSYHKTSTELGV